MFTGIIQASGKIKQIDHHAHDATFFIDCGHLINSGIEIGDSIAVNGCCLTVVLIKNTILKLDVSKETLDRTLFGHYTLDTRLNLELAMQPQSRFGGHIVSGHVDCLAQLTEMYNDGGSQRMNFTLAAPFGRYIAEKGSVTIDGVSLTVNNVKDNLKQTQFGVNIIPHTLEATNLGEYSINKQVHIEIDMLARYLERLNQYGRADD